ncbi:MAG TPA: ATP-binding cassette domain-containing protein [Terriglobales bacterium]|nr:ATP-binding cassette domain-containing protein [Terriglobales bacterium]
MESSSISFPASSSLTTETRVLLSVKDLSVKFGEREVIHGLSCELRRGETLAVIGSNGSGKTVFLRALLGLLSCSGTIRWDESVTIGYVPQRVSLDRELPLRARDLLDAKARFLKYPRREIDHVAEVIGLSKALLDAPVSELSGGQFQKVLIAFALLGHPSVLLFDEPTTSLDGFSERQLYELLRKLKHLQHTSLIWVTHDLGIVSAYASRVLYLNPTGSRFGMPQDLLGEDVIEQLRSEPHHALGGR